jgi:5-methylcytosine-specific restriction endonuclease McrA
MKRPSKKDRIDNARKIIDRNAVFVSFSAEDVEEFSVVCNTKIEAIEKRPNPKFPRDTRHLYMKIGGKDWEAVSWKKLIEGWDEKTAVKKVMRDAISSNIWEFKRNSELLCVRCGSAEYPSVDHVNPPFDRIAEDFIKENGLPKIDDAKDGVGNVFADDDVKDAWIIFHAGRANYQILCRSCNSSKGKR